MRTSWLVSGGLFGLLSLAALVEARPPAVPIPAPRQPGPAFSLPAPHADTIPPLRPGPNCQHAVRHSEPGVYRAGRETEPRG